MPARNFRGGEGFSPAVSDEDAELMVKAGAGDRQAFAALFDRHQLGVTRFALRFVKDRARADELTQDIFVKLYQAARGYRPTARFKTFLFRIATHHCLNEVRRPEYRANREEEDAVEAVPAPHGPEEDLLGRDLERRLQRALEGLGARERAAFAMCRLEGMAYREIAEVLGASEAAVKSLIHRATLTVARQLSPAVGAETESRSAHGL